MAINQFDNIAYVLNRASNSVSVISTENYTKIKDIQVGRLPNALDIDHSTNTVYVVNHASDGISVIDGETNKVVARTVFQVSPFNSGYIVCDGLTSPSPLGQYFYLWSGGECTAKPSRGFEFLSWEENLGDNSAQILRISQPASHIESILDFLGIKSEEPEAQLKITKFGTFTANFKELPPPIPPEYLATLFAVVVSALIGSWLTPTFIQWKRAKRQGKRLDHYHGMLTLLYTGGKLDKNHIGDLDELKNEIRDEYTRGKINKEQFEMLVYDISIAYRELFKKEIDSLNQMSVEDRDRGLNEVKDNVEEAYAKGNISEQQYNLLNKKTAAFTNFSKW